MKLVYEYLTERALIYKTPKSETEYDEARRYQKLSDIRVWEDALSEAKVSYLYKLAHVGNIDLNIKHLDKNKVKRVKAQIAKGTIEYPIVALIDGKYDLVSGNTRVAVLTSMGIKPKVLIVEPKEIVFERVLMNKPTKPIKVTKLELRRAILAEEDISFLDYSEVTDMSRLFIGSDITFELLEKANLDTSLVEFMDYMFDGCHRLVTIPKMDTSNVIGMNYMFSECTSLTSVPHLDTSNVTHMRGIFSGSINLETLKRPSDFRRYDFKDLPKILDKYPELRK
jgi:surface protein